MADYVLVWACWPNFIFYLVGNANNYELLCSTIISLVEQELLTLPEHLHSPPVFSVVRVTRSLVLCICFVDRCLSFCIFSFGHWCLFFFDIRILITPLVSALFLNYVAYWLTIHIVQCFVISKTHTVRCCIGYICILLQFVVVLEIIISYILVWQ